MATVTSRLTRINDLEGAPTIVSIGGGAGAAVNTDIFIQGAQSLGRRLSNVTLSGFQVDDGSNDLSADNVHVGAWLWVTHYASLTDVRFRVGSNSGTANYDEHIFPLTEYSSLGGWVRLWVDISRAPDATGGTALDEATARYFGPTISIPTVGGNAANVIMDAVDQTTTGLILTGSSGVWQDFLTADESNSTNKYGVVASKSGVIYCLARLTLGSTASLSFNDSNFVIVFPQQRLVASNFMGVTCDLQQAATSISFTGGSFQSPGNVKGDLIVSGANGSLTASSCTFSALRAVTLAPKAQILNSTLATCGLIIQSGSVISGSAIFKPTGSVGVLVDRPDFISRNTFTSDGTGHAIECVVTGTYTFIGNVFTAYASSDGSTGNEAFFNNSSGSLTLNVVQGGSTPSVRNGTSASTTVNSSVSVTLTGLQNPTEVRVYTAGTTTELSGQENVTGGTFAFSVGSGVSVDISILSLGYQNQRILNYSTLVDATLPVAQQIDRQYLNP